MMLQTLSTLRSHLGKRQSAATRHVCMVAELYGTIQDTNNRRRTPRVILNRRRRAPWSEPQRGPAGERGQVADKKEVVLGARAKRS